MSIGIERALLLVCEERARQHPSAVPRPCGPLAGAC